MLRFKLAKLCYALVSIENYFQMYATHSVSGVPHINVDQSENCLVWGVGGELLCGVKYPKNLFHVPAAINVWHTNEN